jgi:hypothetical protein
MATAAAVSNTARFITGDLHASLANITSDPNGHSAFHLGRDGVLRSIDANNTVLDYRQLNPSQIEEFLGWLDAAPFNNVTERLVGVDGRNVLDLEQLLTPSEITEAMGLDGETKREVKSPEAKEATVLYGKTKREVIQSEATEAAVLYGKTKREVTIIERQECDLVSCTSIADCGVTCSFCIKSETGSLCI